MLKFQEGRSKALRWQAAPQAVNEIWAKKMEEDWAAVHPAREQYRAEVDIARIATSYAPRFDLTKSPRIIAKASTNYVGGDSLAIWHN